MQKPHGHWDLLSKELYHTQQHRARHSVGSQEDTGCSCAADLRTAARPGLQHVNSENQGRQGRVPTSACTNANFSHGLTSITLSPMPVCENSTSSPNGIGPLLISPASFSSQKALFFRCPYKHTPFLLHCSFSQAKNNVCSRRVSFGEEQKTNFKPKVSLKHFSDLTVRPLATRTVI